MSSPFNDERQGNDDVKRLTIALSTGILACGLVAGGEAPAQASAYSYNCVATNGSSYFLKPGTPLTSCKGSRLQMYYNGRVAYTYSLTLNGQPGNPARASLDCIIAIAGTGAGLVSTNTGVGVWATAASIYGLKACIA